MMINYHNPESKIHVLSRGLIFQGDEVILCRVKGKKWFFLPGGHVENGESARVALLREIQEEIGGSVCEVSSFIGSIENIFKLEENLLQQEINFIFKVEAPIDFNIVSKEDHLEFIKIKVSDIQETNILPASLKDGVVKWLDNKVPFLKELSD